MPTMVKQCSDCQATKPLTEFRRKISKRTGEEFRHSWCFDCLRRRGREGMQRFREAKAKPKVPKFRPGMHGCSICGLQKPKDSFHKNIRRKNGLCNVCIECSKEEYRKTYLKRTYGITVEEYQAMLDAQLGVCAICQGLETVIHMNDKEPRLSVDHDHETGMIRGLLCYRCNHLAGYLERYSEEEVTAAQAYLKHHTQRSATNGDTVQP